MDPKLKGDVKENLVVTLPGTVNKILPAVGNALCANIPETVLVLLINEQGEKEKGRDEREFSWCCFF